MASQTPPAKRRRFDVDLIKVLIGSEKKCFTLHEPVITSRSKFFRAAVDGGFKESVEKIIWLPEIAADTFNNYVQWAYEGKVIVMDAEDVESDSKSSDTKYPKSLKMHYRRLTELYILADTLDDMQLRNRIIDMFHALKTTTGLIPPYNSIKLIYANLPSTATLRRLMVDYWVHATPNPDNGRRFAAAKDHLPADFVFEIASRFISRQILAKPDAITLCTYHEHNEETPACHT